MLAPRRKPRCGPWRGHGGNTSSAAAHECCRAVRLLRARGRLEGEARRVIGSGRMPRGKLKRLIANAGFGLRRNEDKASDQAAPFGNLHGFNRNRGGGRQRLTRTSGVGAGTRLARNVPVGVRLRHDPAEDRVGIDGRAFDVRWIIATGADWGGREESDGQTCQRQADGWMSQMSREDAHQVTHNRS